jgi:hypothetical protein
MSLKPAASTPVTDAIRKSGIKDPIATPIIENILRLGIKMRHRVRNVDEAKVHNTLMEELKKFGDKEIVNPLLLMKGMGFRMLWLRLFSNFHYLVEFNIHEDTPVEILHTVLLGVVKYYWGQTMWHLEHDSTVSLFQSRLNSLSEVGLNIPKILADYMIQYKGGLNGKHFKTIAQIMIFAVPGLVPADVLSAWKALGRLCALCWRTEIDDLEGYLVRLSRRIKFISVMKHGFLSDSLLCRSSLRAQLMTSWISQQRAAQV